MAGYNVAGTFRWDDAGNVYDMKYPYNGGVFLYNNPALAVGYGGGTSGGSQQQPVTSIVTGVNPAEINSALYGKIIPVSALGLARIGSAGLIFGPYFNSGSASFAVSFGFPADPAGTRRVYEIALDGKVVWALGAGSAPGALDASGFVSEAFTCRFYGGTLTQAADALEIAYFGDAAVAYRPQMMLWFHNLKLTNFDGKVPFVSAVIGDTTDGAVPADGINIGEALERVAYSPWLEYTSSDFDTTGTSDIVQGMILTEDQSFVTLLQNTSRLYRTLDIVQRDRLYVIDRGATVAPDLTLTRDHIVEDSVQYMRAEESAVPRELEIITIDPDADYVFVPYKAKRPRHPVPVTSAVGKETITIPVIIGATTRASLATFAKYQEDNARKRIAVQGMVSTYNIEPGDLIGVRSLADGFEPIETYQVVETSHNADWTVDIVAQAILKCSIPTDPPVGDFGNVYYDPTFNSSQQFPDVQIGEAAANRLVIICAAGDTNNRTIDSITINGNTATLHEMIAASGTSFNDPVAAIASLVVPTGTTCSVVVNYSGLLDGSMIAVYTLTDYTSATPFDSDTANVTGGLSDPTVTLDIPAGGFAVAIYTADGSVGGSLVGSWTGLPEDYDLQFTSSNQWASGAHSENLPEGSLEISFSGPAAGRELLAAAVWS
jgi:hypothetical protein